MNFDWDEEKNKRNIKKHGISFEDAKEVFKSPLLTRLDLRENYGEDRYIGLGMIYQRVIVIVYTEIDDLLIRIISARKATKEERRVYEKRFR